MTSSGQPSKGGLQNLDEYRKAIEASGFLLEVRVADVLREDGYLATPNSPIPRPDHPSELIEIDVEASRMDFVSDGMLSRTGTTLLIECKRNSQPIAFFSQPQQHAEVNAYRVAYCADPVSDYEGLLEFMEIETWHHYGKSATVASQLCSFTQNKQGQITTDPCSTYRESLKRLCLATAMRALRLKDKSRENRNPGFGYMIELVYPILVASGHLLSVITDAEGIRVAREDHVQLHRGARVEGALHEYQIDVVTERALPELLSTIKVETDFLAGWAKSHRDALLTQPTKRRTAKQSKRVAAMAVVKSSNKASRNRR